MAIEPLPFQEPGLIHSGGADSILAGIWRQILSDLKVDDAFLMDRINKYAERITKTCPEKMPQVRGNLRTDVGKLEMTWFTFTKCLRALDVDAVEIRFHLKHVHRYSDHTLVEKLEDPSLDKEDDDGGSTRTEPNTLSAFFQGVLHQLDVGIILFEELLNRYMMRNKLDLNPRNRTLQRGYLKKDFYAPRLSWKTVVKGFNFLCVTDMEMEVILTFRRGRISRHHYKAQLGDLALYADEVKTGRGL